jgi:hypothetical protein
MELDFCLRNVPLIVSVRILYGLNVWKDKIYLTRDKK